MNHTIAIGFSAIVVLAVLLSGCTGITPPPGQPTTTATTPPTSVPTTTPAISIQPSPTDVVPAAYAVVVQVQKNTISTNPDITVSYRDGVGAYLVLSMKVEVVRSDGIVESQTVESPDQSTNIVLSGTTGTDRVIVYMTYANGATYKIFDNTEPFQPLYPY